MGELAPDEHILNGLIIVIIKHSRNFPCQSHLPFHTA
jgi:hypothetical protein